MLNKRMVRGTTKEWREVKQKNGERLNKRMARG